MKTLTELRRNEMTKIIQIKQCHPNMIVPVRGSSEASGMDVYPLEDLHIKAQKTKLVKLGFQVMIPKGFEIQIRPRSGLALKHGITVLNTPGTVDADYRGEVGVIVFNSSYEDYFHPKHHAIAQMVMCPVELCNIMLVDQLSETVRGEGGFGSTTKK